MFSIYEILKSSNEPLRQQWDSCPRGGEKKTTLEPQRGQKHHCWDDLLKVWRHRSWFGIRFPKFLAVVPCSVPTALKRDDLPVTFKNNTKICGLGFFCLVSSAVTLVNLTVKIRSPCDAKAWRTMSTLTMWGGARQCHFWICHRQALEMCPFLVLTGQAVCWLMTRRWL